MALSPLPVADVVIVGVGARAPVGLTALQVTMAVRAGKRDVRDTHLIDKHGEVVGLSRLGSIGDGVFGLERFVALGGPALTQAAFPWLEAERRRSSQVAPLPVLLALPHAQRPGLDPRLAKHLLAGLEARSRVPIDGARSELVWDDRAGGARALSLAMERLAAGAPAVLVGGIDSFFDPDLVEHLDRELRLHSANTENGFIPGEGAAFLLVTSRSRGAGLARYAQLLGVGLGTEPRPYGHDEPCLGLGITQALQRAVAAAGTKARRIGWVLTDVVDERHRVDEWSYAFARGSQAFSADVVHEQPLLQTGDVGAASGPLLLAMAATRWQTGSAPSDVVLVATHAEGPPRGVIVASEDGA